MHCVFFDVNDVINMQYPYNPIIKALLAPFSLLYAIVVFIRNLCFDLGIFASREFPFPVISVGNITVGGTGKTPHVEYIVSLLKDEFSIAVLSRGYKRKSSGFVVASTASGVREIGDEPLQIKKKFPDVEVAVDGNRVRGIVNLCRYNRKVNTVILDDAFQHRWVKPGISILLIDYSRPLYTDTLLGNS
jgi:tetraacyldisaccharide 4'-kinase